MRHKNKKGLLLMILGAILILSAVGMIIYNNGMDMMAERFSAYAAEQFINRIETAPEYIHSDEEVPDYILNPNMDMPVFEIDGIYYIGILEIPDLGLMLPVADELSESNLKTSPCRYEGSVYKNDMIIAGHNYRAHFANISKLAVGSSVKFTDADGNEFNFTVTGIETISGTDIDRMFAGDWDLTVFTCNYGGMSRVTIRCSLV